MSSKVRVLYDFTAQPGTSELTIHENEILTLTNKDIGEGWWEGINSRGERGLFPEGYVTIVDDWSAQASSSVNLPPTEPNIQPASTQNQQVDSSQYESTSQHNQFFTPTQTQQFRKHEIVQDSQLAEELDWPGEEWETDDDSGTEYGGPGTGQQGGLPAGPPYYGRSSHAVMSQNVQSDLTATDLAKLNISDNRNLASSAGAIKTKKNFNRFTNFVKSGLECYLLEGKSVNVPISNKATIHHDNELGITWRPNLNPYTCAVTKHGKESKMKGFKTYISYEITPSTTNVAVRRRYKHFDWLMQRLEEKFIVTPIPPLPEKQIAGRFQEDFVEHRRNLLQLWVNYVTRHPLLSQCDVWWHFITCSTDDMKGWKLGKRKAEKDELVGANFFHTVDVNPATTPLDNVKTTKQLDNFQRFVTKFDEAVRHLFATTVDQSKKFSTVYAKDYKKLAESIKELSLAFQSGTAWRNSLSLNEAIRQTSNAYDKISRLHEEEPKYDFEPMADILHQYRGLLSGWSDILQLHRSSMNTRQEQEQLADEGKISEAVLSSFNNRVNVTTYSTLAEINHFHNERLVDFKQMMQVFLTAQINFHTDIVGQLKLALNKINDA